MFDLALGDEQARPLLVAGWGESQASGGRRWVAAYGRGSILQLPTAATVDLEVEVHGRSAQNLGSLRVDVEVAGVSISEVELADRGTALRIALPAAQQRVGSTRLRLVYRDLVGATLPPRQVVAWWSRLVVTELGASRDDEGSVPSVGLVRSVPVSLETPSLAGADAGATDETPLPTVDFPLLESAQDAFAGPVWLSPGTGWSRPVSAPLPCQADLGVSNVVLYVIDTLRRDRLGIHGNPRGLTPHLDRFAAESLVLDRAIAQSPWTRPSVASLLTGLTPLRHGASGRKSRLESGFVTLPEVLSASGYATAAFVTNPNVAGRWGLRQGFDSYETLPPSRSRAVDVNEATAQWLDRRLDGRLDGPLDRGLGRATGERPFLLYLHTIEPHAPYQPAAPFHDRFAAEVGDPDRYRRSEMRRIARGDADIDRDHARREMELLYDATVAENDAAFGALLALLDERGLRENTVIVVVSDHGEEFLEHGHWEHGRSLYTEVLDIPFLIHRPGCAGSRSSAVAQHADLLPTLLDALGLPTPPDLDGRSLLCTDCPPRDVLSHVGIEAFHGIAFTSERLRSIHPEPGSLGGRTLLFDHWRDPAELDPLGERAPIAATYFALRQRAWSGVRAAAPDLDDSQIDPEMLRQLRALGYID